MSEGFMQHAGILDENENLSATAKNKIIERLKKSSEEGFASTSPFPCAAGSSVPSAKGYFPQDIEDETKYPEFHQNILKTYEKIAKVFNMKSAPNLPFPFCDPSALALQLGLDPPKFDLSKLPTLNPVSLALLLNVKIPQIPDLVGAFNIPPELPVPKFDIPTLDVSINLPLPSEFSQKFEFDSWSLKAPETFIKFAGELIANVDIPGILKLAAGQPCVIIDKIVESKTFGPSEGGDVAKQVIVADLSTFTGECASIAAVGSTVGSSPVGATGGLGEKYGYKQPAQQVEGNNIDINARNTIIKAYNFLYNRAPSLREAQFVQVIASAENGYGTAFYDRVESGVDAKGKKLYKLVKTPGSQNCNNWGNIHGQGTAGSFLGTDFTSDGKPYKITFAKYATPVEGCMRLIKELFESRFYIVNCLRISEYAWNSVFLMSSKSVFGSNASKIEAGQNVGPASDAVNPTGITYYTASPTYYYKNFVEALKSINRNVNEESAFNLQNPPENGNSLIGVTMNQINNA